MNMKCKIRKLVCLACMLAMAMVTYAQESESGWSVDEHDYQHQMSVYAKLVTDGNDVTDYSNYEVAAFVGEECRGFATVNSQGGYTWLWMFVRSNSASGETVSFKVYDKTTKEKFKIAETIDFVADGQIGQASSPTTFTIVKYTPGDVNNDGKFSIVDIIGIRRIIAGYTDSNLIYDAADLNGDGKPSISDIIQLRKLIASQSSN